MGSMWHSIEDLPADTGRLELPELRSLDQLWKEKRAELEQLDAMQTFRERLIRSWAIETGVIERVYELDRGTTELLIERGIDAALIDRSSTDKEPELVARIIGDQREAIEALFNFVTRGRALSTSYIKELHATLTRSQDTTEAIDGLGRSVEVPLLKGEWKRLPNNPRRPDGTVHKYTPPEQVASEMDRLVKLHLRHEENGVEPEVEAAWLHHRFTQIHPFQDGNGRVARALASLIFLRAGWFPLTITRDKKSDYIDCLEAADLGELRYLSHLFGSLQRDALVRALGIGDQAVRELEGIEQVVHAARDDLLIGASPRQHEELERVRATAARLQRTGLDEMRRVKRLLDQEISEYRPEFSARVNSSDPSDDNAQWYRREIEEIAEQFHYFANLRTHNAWIELQIAATAFHLQYQVWKDGSRLVRRRTKRQNITDELFQINYLESSDAADERFREWIRGVLTIGLGQWRAGLPVASS